MDRDTPVYQLNLTQDEYDILTAIMVARFDDVSYGLTDERKQQLENIQNRLLTRDLIKLDP